MPFRILPEVLVSVNKPDVRRELSFEMKVTEQTIIRYIRSNDWNGALTSVGALIVITHILSLPLEQVLERQQAEQLPLHLQLPAVNWAPKYDQPA
jgi:hypothetical protein